MMVEEKVSTMVEKERGMRIKLIFFLKEKNGS